MLLQRWDADWGYSTDAFLGKSYARLAAFADVSGSEWNLLQRQRLELP